VYVTLTGDLYAVHGVDADDITQVFLGCYRHRRLAGNVVDHWHNERGLAHRRHLNWRVDLYNWSAEDAEREVKKREQPYARRLPGWPAARQATALEADGRQSASGLSAITARAACTRRKPAIS